MSFFGFGFQMILLMDENPTPPGMYKNLVKQWDKTTYQLVQDFCPINNMLTWIWKFSEGEKTSCKMVPNHQHDRVCKKGWWLYALENIGRFFFWQSYKIRKLFRIVPLGCNFVTQQDVHPKTKKLAWHWKQPSMNESMYTPQKLTWHWKISHFQL